MTETTAKEQYVEFGIDAELYAIPIQDIDEVIKIQTITPLPTVREYVKGVINLRGRIVPVISLRCLLGLADAEYTKSSRIIVIHHRKESIGLIVDYVNKVTTFSDIQVPPERIGGSTGGYFAGIGVSDHGLAGILRLEELLLYVQGR